MKMTELKDPVILSSQLFGAAKIVAHDGADAFSDFGRNRFDELHPSLQTFGPLKKQRIQKDGVMTSDRLEGSQTKNPRLIFEREPCPIEQEDQSAFGKFLRIFLSEEPLKDFSKSVTQTLRSEMVLPTQTDERSLLPKDSLEQNKTRSPGRPTSSLDSNSPSPSALSALTSSSTKSKNPGTTTNRYSDRHVFHANRVATFRGAGKNLLSDEFSYI
jgi:hypothetical protein